MARAPCVCVCIWALLPFTEGRIIACVWLSKIIFITGELTGSLCEKAANGRHSVLPNYDPCLQVAEAISNWFIHIANLLERFSGVTQNSKTLLIIRIQEDGNLHSRSSRTFPEFLLFSLFTFSSPFWGSCWPFRGQVPIPGGINCVQAAGLPR